LEAVERTAVRGVDPRARRHVVHVDAPATGARTADREVWSTAIDAARRAVAAELAGACRAMLGLACAHAVERVQFGRPIARFQAVRHRLADAFVAAEALDAARAAAQDEPGPATAALAKAIAGRSARTVATHCQQVLAGIGFTTEHPFHRYLQRTMALEGCFGTSDDLTTELGRELLSRRAVPTLIEL
jgi:alkylation response protein AidB-like acyl-CoA dehydrogenase